MKQISSLWLQDEIKNVWMISVELWPIASLGGLGNAVYNISKNLVEMGISTTVIMPSHGRHLNDYYRSLLKLHELPIRVEGIRKGIDNKYYSYKIGFEEGFYDNIRIILVKGLDYDTGKMLGAWNIYDNIMEKSSLLARGIEGFILNKLPNDIPSLIHIHDWHSVIAGIKAKEVLESRRIIVPVVFTIHLLNKVTVPWHYASEEWSGLLDCPHYIWRVYKHELLRTSFVWNELSNSYIEKFGIYEADLVTTVSWSYMTSEIYNFVGNWIENKSCVNYNGTDWNINDVRLEAKKRFGTDDRREVKRKLFNLLSNIKSIPQDYTTGSILWQHRHGLGIRDDWTYEPLQDGPLILFTGRIVYQKGVDLLIRAFKQLLVTHPNSRLIILGIPSGDYNLLYDLIYNAMDVKDNIRIILGPIDRPLYQLFHYASNVYVAPSRWEPFGITVIEAMAVGTPVIGYATGGMNESIIDLRKDPTRGTGFLVEPNSIGELARALREAINLSIADELDDEKYLKNLEIIKINDVKFWSKVRDNCVKRVDENFRWGPIVKKIVNNCYSKAIEMARYRALACF